MQSKEAQNPLYYLFSKAWRFSAGNRKMVVTFWTLFVIANAITLLFQPFIWAKMIDVIQKGGITEATIGTLFLLLALTIVVDIAFWTFHGPGRLIERANAFKVRANYRKHLLQGVMALPMEWQADHHSGDTIDKVEKGAGGLYSFSEGSFEVISAIVQLAISYAVLAYFSIPAAGIVFAMVLLTCYIIMRFDRVLVGQYIELARAENRVSEGVFDALSNITTVIILRVERLVFETIAHKIEKPYGLFKKNARISELKWFLVSMCATTMTVSVLGLYFWQHARGGEVVLVASVYLLINYLGRITELFFKFAYMYGELLERKAKVMNAEEVAKDFREENLADHVLPRDWRRLEVEGVQFSYQNSEGTELHLNNVSLSLARGERIALVGESGSGKTTLLKVMRDLYHPERMRLCVDGKDIPHGFAGIREAIALVPQDPEIFGTTILENITLGAEHDMDFVHKFTDMACFTEVALHLPKKFDSSIKEKGVNLSGGQQQRLALARGLLACDDKDIVLLDEPTSSLDTGTEMKVYQNIFREFDGKTIVASVHRLHLLPLFDRICVFDEGRIVGVGTLAELLVSCPLFAELWRTYHEHKHKRPKAKTRASDEVTLATLEVPLS